MQENTLLHFVSYGLQEVTLAFMVVVYIARLLWLFRFRAGRDLQAPTGRSSTGPFQGAAYSVAAVGMPWTMESARTHLLYWLQFVVFHLGVVVTIALSLLVPYAPSALASQIVIRLFQVLIGLGFLVGCYRMARRILDPAVRAVSSPDDYFALGLLLAWFVSGWLVAGSHPAGGRPVAGQLAGDPSFLLIFFLIAAVFHVYVPFSKILHYLYYPFTRYYLGKTLGYRGVYPIERSHLPAKGRRTRQASSGTQAGEA